MNHVAAVIYVGDDAAGRAPDGRRTQLDLDLGRSAGHVLNVEHVHVGQSDEDLVRAGRAADNGASPVLGASDSETDGSPFCLLRVL